MKFTNFKFQKENYKDLKILVTFEFTRSNLSYWLKIKIMGTSAKCTVRLKLAYIQIDSLTEVKYTSIDIKI